MKNKMILIILSIIIIGSIGFVASGNPINSVSLGTKNIFLNTPLSTFNGLHGGLSSADNPTYSNPDSNFTGTYTVTYDENGNELPNGIAPREIEIGENYTFDPVNFNIGQYDVLSPKYDCALIRAIVDSPYANKLNLYKAHINDFGDVKFDENISFTKRTSDDELLLTNINGTPSNLPKFYLLEGANEAIGRSGTDESGININFNINRIGGDGKLTQDTFYFYSNVTKRNVNVNVITPPTVKIHPNNTVALTKIPVEVSTNYQLGVNSNPIPSDLKLQLVFTDKSNSARSFTSQSFSGTYNPQSGKYNIDAPALIGDTNYTVSVKIAPESDSTYRIISPKDGNVTTKIRPVLTILNGTNNVGYDKTAPFNHVVSYKLTNDRNGAPIASRSISFQSDIPAATTDNNGIVNANYTAFGTYNLAANFNAADNDIVTTKTIDSPNLTIYKIAGADKQIIVHTVSSGSVFKASHWNSPNGFNFSDDKNWALAFEAETRIKFYDVDKNQIGSDEHFTLLSGSSDRYINVPYNAYTMDIECGAKSSGDHTTKTGIEAGPGAINYDGTVGGAASTKNCHVQTDTWDSGYIKLHNGFHN
ncbi:MAG: hypothetical protein LBT10_09310 [Methanobrevibacter sp.]|jgi:hypothetical protein|nr:hypothetical protein [Methanobrevibacter sp.]